jgi:hypothetical protein
MSTRACVDPSIQLATMRTKLQRIERTMRPRRHRYKRTMRAHQAQAQQPNRARSSQCRLHYMRTKRIDAPSVQQACTKHVLSMHLACTKHAPSMHPVLPGQSTRFYQTATQAQTPPKAIVMVLPGQSTRFYQVKAPGSTTLRIKRNTASSGHHASCMVRSQTYQQAILHEAACNCPSDSAPSVAASKQ